MTSNKLQSDFGKRNKTHGLGSPDRIRISLTKRIDSPPIKYLFFLIIISIVPRPQKLKERVSSFFVLESLLDLWIFCNIRCSRTDKMKSGLICWDFHSNSPGSVNFWIIFFNLRYGIHSQSAVFGLGRETVRRRSFVKIVGARARCMWFSRIIGTFARIDNFLVSFLDGFFRTKKFNFEGILRPSDLEIRALAAARA